MEKERAVSDEGAYLPEPHGQKIRRFVIVANSEYVGDLEDGFQGSPDGAIKVNQLYRYEDDALTVLRTLQAQRSQFFRGHTVRPVYVTFAYHEPTEEPSLPGRAPEPEDDHMPGIDEILNRK